MSKETTTGLVIWKDVKTEIGEARKDELAREVTAHVLRYRDLEEQKKAATKDISAKMKTERGDWERKADAIRTGILDETIECYEEQNFSINEMAYRRVDSGEKVASRPMRQDERQLAIDGTQPAAPVISIDKGKTKKRMKAEGAPSEEETH